MSTTPLFSSKVPLWMRQIEELPKRKIFGAASGEIADGAALAAEALYGYRLTEKSYFCNFGVEDKNASLSAFAYLWRRFGPPCRGSDPDKQLVRYILGTPHKQVWLTINLGACSLQLSIGYFAEKVLLDRLYAPLWKWQSRKLKWLKKHKGITSSYVELDSETRKELSAAIGECPHPPLGYDWLKGPPVMVAANKALIAALHELLRPVYVRDVPINILGRCDDSEHSAEPSEMSGYGIDLKHHRNMIAKMEKKT